MGCGVSVDKKNQYPVLDRSTQTHWGWTLDPHIARIPPVKADHFVPVLALGKGKFGMVFLSLHKPSNTTGNPHNNKFVAIKFIPKVIIHECKAVDRIQGELDIVHAMSHPFILHCFGTFDAPSALGIVFEAAMGGELYTRIRKLHTSIAERKGVSIDNIVRFYAAEIALALHYLHDVMHICYRDLKPENILIDHAGHVKLCDFGFAVRLSTSSVSTSLTSVSTALASTGGGVSPYTSGGVINNSSMYSQLQKPASASTVSQASSQSPSRVSTPDRAAGHGAEKRVAAINPHQYEHTANCSHSGAVFPNTLSAATTEFSSPAHDFDVSKHPTLYDGCGTAMYVAPEIAGGFMKQAHSYPVDWWGLGIIIYEMFVGTAPFGDTDKMSKFEIFNNILQNEPKYPFHILGEAVSLPARSLISGLLDKDATRRLKYNTFRTHEFMKCMNFEAVFDKRIRPPWIPEIEEVPTLVNNLDARSSKSMKGMVENRDDIAHNFIRWEKLNVPDYNAKCAFDVASYCHFSLPRPLIIAKNIVTAKDPNLISGSSSNSNNNGVNLSRKPSLQLLGNGNTTGGNNAVIATSASQSPSGAGVGALVLAGRGNSSAKLNRGNSSIGFSTNSGSTKGWNDNYGYGAGHGDGYEYDPSALGIVTKRAWDEKLDLAYEEDKPKNIRTKRPGQAIGGNVIIKVGGSDNNDLHGTGSVITRQASSKGSALISQSQSNTNSPIGNTVVPSISRQGSSRLVKTPSRKSRTFSNG